MGAVRRPGVGLCRGREMGRFPCIAEIDHDFAEIGPSASTMPWAGRDPGGNG